MGVQRVRTTPYHPQGNGALERFHRGLKASLTARLSENESWDEELPTVLLGLRAALRCETGLSAAELVYGQALRLPGDFYSEVSPKYDGDDYTYVNKLRAILKSVCPKPRSASDSRKIFVYKDLSTCSHVFIRNDAVRKPLTPTYNGPYRVISRQNKVFKIQLTNRQVNISIDRLKPAYLMQETEPSPVALSSNVPTSRISCGDTSTNLSGNSLNGKTAYVRTTQSGRVVKQPVRFADYA